MKNVPVRSRKTPLPTVVAKRMRGEVASRANFDKNGSESFVRVRLSSAEFVQLEPWASFYSAGMKNPGPKATQTVNYTYCLAAPSNFLAAMEKTRSGQWTNSGKAPTAYCSTMTISVAWPAWPFLLTRLWGRHFQLGFSNIITLTSCKLIGLDYGGFSM